MAESNHQNQGDFTNTPSGHQMFSNTTSSTQNNESISQPQQHTSRTDASASPFDGILRTESGHETYFPDGHQSSNQGQVQRPTSGGSYGLFPATGKREEPLKSNRDTSTAGAGLFGASEGHTDQANNEQYLHNGAEEQLEPLEKVATKSSSDSSFTRYGSNGQRRSRKGTKVSDTDDSEGSPMERTVTRPEIDDEERGNLQRALTSMSMSRQGTRHSIADPNDPSMDPSSDSFDLTKFLRSFRHYLEGEGVEMKQLSVVYKNLSVYGSGAALQLQKTVSDMFMAPIRPQEFFSFGKKDRKQILHNFDGIIKAGELCVVLGRPGSGCSTLLKALTGELHGLEIDGSEVHYNGIEQDKVIKEFKGETVYNQEVCCLSDFTRSNTNFRSTSISLT
jgi:ATP-binding cassette subfamily G (WHITE) protein 2 (PDR)